MKVNLIVLTVIPRSIDDIIVMIVQICITHPFAKKPHHSDKKHKKKNIVIWVKLQNKEKKSYKMSDDSK